MEPIGNVWNKFPRLVRDLEQTCGKQVRLVCTGETTELDRTLLQAIRDPLTHLVRNAIDHGIEAPADRKRAGKAPTGLLTLRAYHEGGLVNIEMTDDGAGIDPERVKQHAVQRGLLNETQAARLSEREAVELIFLPGFSTAEKVSNVSGRGVGMDVVKTHIEKIGGVVDVLTGTGRGTTFKIRIPLTLAIIPALTISCAGERYAIPQVNVTELLSLKREGLEQLQDALVHRLRGSLLPILHLARELQLAPAETESEHVQVVVVQAGERRFGLIVDEVHDAGEIVVKPLGRILKGTPCLAGATIMGDGSVALIIDVFSLARRAELISAEAHGHAATQAAVPAVETHTEELLLFALGERHLAIPVTAVARLEEFPRGAIEYSGGRSAVQYRGQILPLFGATGSLAHALTHTLGDTICAIVYTEHGRSAGLVVSRIDDIVRHASALQCGTRRRGLLGSAVIDEHVTDVIDAGEMVRAEDPAFYEEANA
jgi:two-component system chemotaxis sensor kinase CheA